MYPRGGEDIGEWKRTGWFGEGFVLVVAQCRGCWNLDGVNGRLRRSEFRRVLWTDLWLLLGGGIEVESSGFVAVNMAIGVDLVADSVDRSSV